MKTAEILGTFSKLKALVVGDICLDRWCTYDPAISEPSRETRIPRIGVVSSQPTPGGGGTVCNNLAAMGAGQVAALGVCGNDGFGFELQQALAERGILADRMVRVQNWQTFTYTKLLNSQTSEEDKPRVDFISTCPLPKEAEQQVIVNLRAVLPSFDVILIADQAETHAGGVVTEAVRDCLIDLAGKFTQKVFLADSRKRVHLFRKVILKPNREEAQAASHSLLGTVDFPALRRKLETDVLIVTHGPKGALVVEDGKETWAEARHVEKPVDICGAGDSFAAACALTLAVTGDPVVAARMGNLAASVTILKKGTGTASPEEILTAARKA